MRKTPFDLQGKRANGTILINMSFLSNLFGHPEPPPEIFLTAGDGIGVSLPVEESITGSCILTFCASRDPSNKLIHILLTRRGEVELQLAWSMKIPTIFLNMGGAVILMDKGSFLYCVIIEGGGRCLAK